MSRYGRNVIVRAFASFVVIAGSLLLYYIWPAHDKSPDNIACEALENAHAASVAFFASNPEGSVDYKALQDYGFAPYPDVGIILLGNQNKRLFILSRHQDGDNIFSCDAEGVLRKIHWYYYPPPGADDTRRHP